jgi:RNA polymerase sigma-70 factor (ECF subfamily)
MPAQNDSAELGAFEQERPRLFGIAYRMLGSAADAEDVLQDAFLRWRAPEAHAHIRSAQAFLTTVVTRLCLDRLKSAHAQRETYIGPWLPQPVLTQPDDAVAHAEMNESISLALLTLLERLNPIERAVFLLRAVFDYEYAEIAEFVDKSEAACRQIFSRAQAFVRDNRPRRAATPEAHRAVLNSFLAALGTGDLSGITELLHESVVAYGDGGGKAFAAARPVMGVQQVAKFMLGLRRMLPEEFVPSVEVLNGEAALVIRAAGAPATGGVFSTLSIETDGQRIYAIRSVVNPDKLSLPFVHV